MSDTNFTNSRSLPIILLTVLGVACAGLPPAPGNVIDHPPDASAPPRAGGALPGLSRAQQVLFGQGKEAFNEIDTVKGGNDTSAGLGPRFNLNSCAGCHAFPAVGGSSGFVNPEPRVATADGATNQAVIPFLRSDGPIVEARFKWLVDADGNFLRASDGRSASGLRPDGGVHALFTITHRTDAGDCTIPQPPFERAWTNNNVTLRIPTPLFGLGLIEAISDATIEGNSLEMLRRISTAPTTANDLRASQSRVMFSVHKQLGIAGRPGRGRENRSGNDSTITRFGWKAQNKSLLLFAGEAYNVEQGVTNELFPNERDDEPVRLPNACKTNATPEDDFKFAENATGDLTKFELFMRLLSPPQPACDLTQDGGCAPNIVRGSQVFDQISCSACHVRQLRIGASSILAIEAQQYAHLYSDLLLHRMGRCAANADHTPKCLADDIAQGQAQGDEFRTAPLWGAGQRVFFLHDGRARNLPAAILAHKGPGSEANAVIKLYERLPDTSKQDLIDFLRSL